MKENEDCDVSREYVHIIWVCEACVKHACAQCTTFAYPVNMGGWAVSNNCRSQLLCLKQCKDCGSEHDCHAASCALWPSSLAGRSHATCEHCVGCAVECGLSNSVSRQENGAQVGGSRLHRVDLKLFGQISCGGSEKAGSNQDASRNNMIKCLRYGVASSASRARGRLGCY